MIVSNRFYLHYSKSFVVLFVNIDQKTEKKLLKHVLTVQISLNIKVLV